MKVHPTLAVISCAVLGVVLTSAAAARAESFTFTIDPAESVIQAGGFIPLVDVTAVPQGSGADVTTYSGALTVDLDDLAAPTSIEFLGGAVAAADSGSWLPDENGGSVGGPDFGDADAGFPAPASYGLFASASLGDLYLALRGIVISPTSDSQAIAGGEFASDIALNTIAGTSDYNFNASSFLFGDRAVSDSMIGVVGENMAGPATYEVAAGVAKITAPVNVLFEIEDAGTGFVVFELSYVGTIVATRTLQTFSDGDFDEDGDVDGDDFLAWQSGFGTSSGATHGGGDADGDGDVDGDDFLVWQSEFGSADGGLGGDAVPEPASWLLAAAVFFFAAQCVKRQ